MKKYTFLLCLLASTATIIPAPKPKNQFLEVLGQMKMLTGFALIPLSMALAECNETDHREYLLSSQNKKDLGMFAPIHPSHILVGGLITGVALLLWGACDVHESKESFEESN